MPLQRGNPSPGLLRPDGRLVSGRVLAALRTEYGELPSVGDHRFRDLARFLRGSYHCAAPTVETVNTVEANGTSFVVSSGSPSDGELVVLWAHTDGGETFTWPTDFTERARQQSPTPAHTLAVADKEAGASEPANYTVTVSSSERIVGGCIVLSHASGTPVFQQVGGGQGADNQAAPAATSITTSADDTRVFNAFVRELNELVSENAGYTSGWDGHYALETGTPGSVSGGVQSKAFPTSSTATGTVTWDITNFVTTSNRSWRCFSVAYEPPAAGGGPDLAPEAAIMAL